MNDVERLAYLHAMGIDSYITRTVLSGAKPSPVQVVNAPEIVAPVTQTVDLTKPRALAELQQELAASIPKAAARKRDSGVATVTPVPARTEPEMPVKLQLAIFHPAPHLLALVPASQTQPAQVQLLVKILQAIDINIALLAPVDRFDWPPRSATAGRLGADIDSAREVLFSMLEGYQHKTPLRDVLVFSEVLGQQLFATTMPANLAVHVVPGLQEMLESPEQKKITWQRLRSLKK